MADRILSDGGIYAIRNKIGNQYAKGFKHSDETRAKVSAANTGKKHSEESRRKISEGNKGKVFSEETKRKMSESAKARRLREKQ